MLIGHKKCADGELLKICTIKVDVFAYFNPVRILIEFPIRPQMRN